MHFTAIDLDSHRGFAWDSPGKGTINPSVSSLECSFLQPFTFQNFFKSLLSGRAKKHEVEALWDWHSVWTPLMMTHPKRVLKVVGVPKVWFRRLWHILWLNMSAPRSMPIYSGCPNLGQPIAVPLGVSNCDHTLLAAWEGCWSVTVCMTTSSTGTVLPLP